VLRKGKRGVRGGNEDKRKRRRNKQRKGVLRKGRIGLKRGKKGERERKGERVEVDNKVPILYVICLR